jgi:multiple antibiotic resistance protein
MSVENSWAARQGSGAAWRNILVEAAKSLFLILSALFPIVDPLGGSPIFLAMTREYSPSTRRALSLRIAMNSFFLLVGSYFIGTHILSFFGISLPVVQVGGGLIVISTGWTLLKQGNDDDQKGAKKKIQPKDAFRNAFYPLTLPLTVGPGSISVAITLGANAPHHQGFNVLSILTAIVGSVLLAASIFLCYGFADRLGRVLGATGMTVIMQLTSFLLVCIGVQILWNGASSLLVSLPLHMR